MKTQSIFLVLFVFGSGCSSVNTNILLSPVESPEGLGQSGKVSLGAGFAPGMNIQVVGDASKRPPDFTDKAMTPGAAIVTSNFGVGVFDPLDLFVRVSPLNEWIFGARFQILGPSKQTAKAGDWSLAAILTGYRSQHGRSGDQNGTLGPGGFNWDSSVTSTLQDLSLMVGNRLGDRVLLYGGLGLATYNISGNIHHARSSDGTSPDANYPFDGGGISTNIKFGIQLQAGSRVFFKIEGVHSNFELNNYAKRPVTGLGFTFEVVL